MKTKRIRINEIAFFGILALFLFFVITACNYLDQGSLFSEFVLYKVLLIWMILIVLYLVGCFPVTTWPVTWWRSILVFILFCASLCIYSAFNHFRYFSIWIIIVPSALMTACAILASVLKTKMHNKA